jgi:tripartite-type tricarboxylate transporter receptor subunit TctC
MLIHRRAILAAPVLLAAPALGQPAWPSRPIRIIVPYAAGGGTDILARALGEALRPALPFPIVVENRAGGNGVIGTEALAKSAPSAEKAAARTPPRWPCSV